MGVKKNIDANGPVDAMEFLVDKLKQSKSNEDFFRAMNK